MSVSRRGSPASRPSPQYRLASGPTRARFPAALQDAWSAYLHLVREMGVAPGRVVLSGDSAGANLVLGLLRYVAEYGPGLGVPGGE